MLKLAAYLLLFLATCSALALYRRRADYLVPAAFLSAVLLASLTRLAIAPHIGVGPAGMAFFHLEESLFIMEPAGIAAAAVAVFWRPLAALAIAPAWFLACAALATSGPLDEVQLARVYLAAEDAAVCVGYGALVTSAIRWVESPKAPTKREAYLRVLPRLSVALILGTELVSLLWGPWRHGLFTRWDLAQVAQIGLYGLLAVLQGVAIVLARKSYCAAPSDG